MSRLWVSELSDSYGPPWPYGLKLHVGVAAGDPEKRIETLVRSKRKALQEIARHVVRPRQDLCSGGEFTSSTSARAAKGQAVRDLRAQGHWVNGRGDLYRIYVVELDDDVGPKTGRSDMPWLYVGETGLDPKVRIEQHRTGAHNRKGKLYAKVVRDHFVRVRQDLSADIPPVHTRPASKQREAETAASLEAQGYSVRWG
jgi:hypothetical protein